MQDLYENAYAEYRLDSEIVFISYKQQVLTLQAAQKVVYDRLFLQGDRAYLVYCDVRNILDTDKEARDYLAREGAALTRAVAFRISGPVSESMLNFYLQRTNPQIPTQLFFKKKSALFFLNKHR